MSSTRRPPPCPLCRIPLDLRPWEGGLIGVCHRCDVTWVSRADFERILQQAPRAFHPDDVTQLRQRCRQRQQDAVAKAFDGGSGVTYLRCPKCSQPMNRRAFAEVSGVPMQVCLPHGVLFEGAGFRDAMEFVSHGGELLSLQRRIDDLSRQLSRANGKLRQPEDATGRREDPAGFPFFFD